MYENAGRQPTLATGLQGYLSPKNANFFRKNKEGNYRQFLWIIPKQDPGKFRPWEVWRQ
jgi:hypothetical protein